MAHRRDRLAGRGEILRQLVGLGAHAQAVDVHGAPGDHKEVEVASVHVLESAIRRVVNALMLVVDHAVRRIGVARARHGHLDPGGAKVLDGTGELGFLDAKRGDDHEGALLREALLCGGLTRDLPCGI